MDAARPVLAFHTAAVPDGTLLVARLEGEELISRPYRFDLALVSAKPDVDFRAILQNPARIDVELDAAGTATLPIHGRILSFEETGKEGDEVSYRAVLAPRLALLAISYQSRIFLGRTILQIVEELLRSAGIGTDFEWRLRDREAYAAIEYVVQYEESDLDFLHRWLEHEGIFYFFEQGAASEKVVFGDTADACRPFRPDPAVRFSRRADTEEAGPLGQWNRDEKITAFACRQERLPKEVLLKDYNWRNPTVELRAKATVDPNGAGIVYEYNNHFKTKEEGDALAKVRAEELLCRERVFSAAGDCLAFRAGRVWELKDHFRADFNARYLLTEIRHRAAQGFLTGRPSTASYRNESVSIPADRVFRPRRTTPWPAIHGSMHARVDASGDGKYAEIDELGRYKVKLPLDLSDAAGGTASRWIRMAQPYAGADHGMHFPLHKDTEVLITHLDGDPDRPVITGAVPDASTGNVVHSGTNSMSGIKTAGGNQIAIEDNEDHRRIVLKAGANESGIMVGSGSGERVEITSPESTTMGWASNFAGGAFTSIMGAACSSMTAGYTLAQVLIAGAKMTWNFLDRDLLGQYLTNQPDQKPTYEGQERMKGLGWHPALASLITVPIMVLGEMLFTKLFNVFVKSNIETIVKQQAMVPTAAADNAPWYSVFTGVATEIKNALIGAATYGYGAYFVRCGGGTRIQLNRLGESIIIASELGQVNLVGQGVSLNSEHEGLMMAKEAIYCGTGTAGLRITKNAAALECLNPTTTLVLNKEGADLRSPDGVYLSVNEGPAPKSPGQSTYIFLRKDGGAQFSVKKELSLISPENHWVKLAASGIQLVTSPGLDGCEVNLSKSGEAKIMAKKIKILAESIEIGDGESAVKIKGKSIELGSSGTFKIDSGSPMQINGQTFGPPPVPPVVPPVRALAQPKNATHLPKVLVDLKETPIGRLLGL